MLSLLRREDGFGFSLGLFATMGQVILMREALGLSGGNELTVGLSLAAWLAGVGVGAVFAGRLIRPRKYLILASIAAPIMVGVGTLSLRLYRSLLTLLPGSDPLLGQLVLFVSICLLGGGVAVGFLFTVVARGSEAGEAKPVSRLYVAEGLGALVGGVLFTFVLSAHLWHLESLGLVGAALLGAAAWMKWGGRFRSVAAVLSLLIVVLLISGAWKRLDDWAEREFFTQLISGGEIVSRGYSHYGRVTLGQAEDQFFLLIDGRLDHAFPDPWDRPFGVHLAMSSHQRPEHVLLVGGGPSDRLLGVLAHGPREVIFTHTDASAHDISLPHWSEEVRAALQDPRVEVVRADGRHFVSSCENRFDVIIVATQQIQSSGANRYHTREFFSAARRALRKGGVLSVLSPGGANMLAPEAARVTASERKTLAGVFPEVVAVPGEHVTFLAAVSKGSLPRSSLELAKRFADHGAAVSGFSPRRFQPVYEKNRLVELERQLAAWPNVAENTDSRPFAYLAGLQLWERSLSRRGTAGNETLLGLAERWALLALLFPLVALVLWMFLVRPRALGPPSMAIATTGAAGMAMEVTALYVYQGTSGQLYSGLALLIALFMAGLSGGAYIAHRWKDASGLAKSVGVELFVLLMLGVMGPVLESAFVYPRIVWIWSAISGAATGAAFPILMGRAARHCGGEQRVVAALMESADHFGASFGALICGVLWLPVYGIASVGLLFAALKTLSLVSLFLRFQEK